MSDREALVCACKKPKPVTVIEDHFGGLFTEEPLYSVEYEYCDRCALFIRRTQ